MTTDGVNHHSTAAASTADACAGMVRRSSRHRTDDPELADCPDSDHCWRRVLARKTVAAATLLPEGRAWNGEHRSTVPVNDLCIINHASFYHFIISSSFYLNAHCLRMASVSWDVPILGRRMPSAVALPSSWAAAPAASPRGCHQSRGVSRGPAQTPCVGCSLASLTCLSSHVIHMTYPIQKMMNAPMASCMVMHWSWPPMPAPFLQVPFSLNLLQAGRPATLLSGRQRRRRKG